MLLGNCRSIYYPAIDTVVLKFMIEACWAPILAAFSVPLDQSDDEIVIALCLEGFRNAIHVTAGMSMKTHRDAFLTSLAKFTSLHSPADIKKKNIDAIKVNISSLCLLCMIYLIMVRVKPSHSFYVLKCFLFCVSLAFPFLLNTLY